MFKITKTGQKTFEQICQEVKDDLLRLGWVITQVEQSPNDIINTADKDGSLVCIAFERLENFQAIHIHSENSLSRAKANGLTRAVLYCTIGCVYKEI
jgi:hypothetical protein